MYERGPIQEYEITWATGHVERIKAHQVSYPNAVTHKPGVVSFHGEIGGEWLLILTALEADLTRIRNVTQTESILEDNDNG